MELKLVEGYTNGENLNNYNKNIIIYIINMSTITLKIQISMNSAYFKIKLLQN